MHRFYLGRSAALLIIAVLALSSCAHNETKTTSAPPEAPKAAPMPVQSVVAAPAPAPAPAPSQPASAEPPVKLLGVVQSVDPDGHLVVKDKNGKTHTLTVTTDASITKGGDDKAAAVADIKVGDHLKLKVAGDQALTIHILVNASKSGQVAAAQ